LSTLLQVALSNAVMATGLALLALVISSLWRRPAVTHCLWVLVLLKLVTPPLVLVPLPWLNEEDRVSTAREPEVKSPAPNAFVELPHLDPAGEEGPGEQEMADGRGGNAGPADNGPVPGRDEVAMVLPPRPAEAPVAPTLSNILPGLSHWESLWAPALLAVWAVGSLAWFGLASFRLARFHRLVRHGMPAPPLLQQQARALARRMGLSRCPTIRLVPGVISPLLWTLFGPGRLIVPADLLARLNGEQQLTLLAHELAHLRRRDPWIRCLEFLVLGLYWWHPVVWWARREIREAEELCCDAWVVWALPGAARAYATALVDTVDFLSEARPALPPLASGIGHFHILRRRLTMIMRGTNPQTLTFAGFLAVLALGVVLLPLMPTLGRSEQPRPGGTRDRPTGERPGPGGGGRTQDRDLAKAREDVKALAEQIRALRADLEAKSKVLAEAEARLRDAKQRLDQAEKEKARNRGRRDADRDEGTDRRDADRDQRRPRRRNRTPEQRIEELERKLDILIREMAALRKELRGAKPGERRNVPPARERGRVGGDERGGRSPVGPGGQNRPPMGGDRRAPVGPGPDGEPGPPRGPGQGGRPTAR
jgi:beta-lactamase regulating signal transducer with metallopeptidase domain